MDKLPVKQCLLMCFYSVENGTNGVELFKKQCGSHLYYWTYDKNREVWKFVITSMTLKLPNCWHFEEIPNKPIEPHEIYRMEAEGSPEYHTFSFTTDEEGKDTCIYNNMGYWSYVIHGENS